MRQRATLRRSRIWNPRGKCKNKKWRWWWRCRCPGRRWSRACRGRSGSGSGTTPSWSSSPRRSGTSPSPAHSRWVPWRRDYWGEETKLRAQHFTLFGVQCKLLTDSFALKMTTQWTRTNSQLWRKHKIEFANRFLHPNTHQHTSIHASTYTILSLSFPTSNFMVS